MFNSRLTSVRVLCPAALVALAGASAPALADFTYSDFVSPANLKLNGVATLFEGGLSVTPPVARSAGSAWHTQLQDVSLGFTTDFTFRVRDKSGIGSDGFAFVVQNSFTPDAGVSGGISGVVGNTGINALGAGGGALGYASNLAFPSAGVGINNSIAVEFDLFNNQTNWDDFNSDNHISVHSMGLLANQPNAATSLGHAFPAADMSTGDLYDVRIVYTPGVLSLFMKLSSAGAFGPAVLTINGFDISTAMQLAPGNNAGQALVGFTAGTGGAANVERHEITRWSFQSVVVPAPASAGILALAGLTAGRRRRR